MKRRNTPSKQAVMDLMRSAGTALSQEDIEEKLKGTMDRVTVYRILNRFFEDGYMHKIVSDDGKFYYAICLNCKEQHHHDHFHFKCLKCEKIECLNEKVQVTVPMGYKVSNVNCLLTGYCSMCA